MDKNYGVITEQNDLGMGFDILNDKDQKIYHESLDKKENQTEKENKE